MRVKVKIFQESDFEELQKVINEWLDRKPTIQVEHVAQSVIEGGEHGGTAVTISIWYTLGRYA